MSKRDFIAGYMAAQASTVKRAQSFDDLRGSAHWGDTASWVAEMAQSTGDDYARYFDSAEKDWEYAQRKFDDARSEYDKQISRLEEGLRRDVDNLVEIALMKLEKEIEDSGDGGLLESLRMNEDEAANFIRVFAENVFLNQYPNVSDHI